MVAKVAYLTLSRSCIKDCCEGLTPNSGPCIIDTAVTVIVTPLGGLQYIFYCERLDALQI